MRCLSTFLAGAALAVIAAPAFALAAPSQTPGPSPQAVAEAALAEAPVWDGHNDVPEQLRDRRKDMLAGFDFTDTRRTADGTHGAMQTDLTRLAKGNVGAQFWSVYVSADLAGPQAVQATMEQIDVMKRLIAQHPTQMQYCEDSGCVRAAWQAHRIASLLGMEGGHSVNGSLGVLRQMYTLGARYMTLTHFKNTAWADSATDAPTHNGLTPFGRDVVREMQRMGMLVDLSHVAESTMLGALDAARAPVMFSHSSARALDDHPRNVSDAVLDRLKANGGIIMVNTYPPYVSEEVRRWGVADAAAKAGADANHPGAPSVAEAEYATWGAAHPKPRASLTQVADHIDHIVRRIGVDHVGIGGDFDGIEDTAEGMEDVSTYPALFTELARRGYSKASLAKIASGNMLRVLQAAEDYAAAHRADPPIESTTSF